MLPVAPRVLILGTLPSVQSCATQQYYGNPQNHFWKIVAPVTGVSHERSYARRVAALKRKRIGLWDVLAAGDRTGSGDATLGRARVNDIGALLESYGTLRALLLNGRGAEKYFRQHWSLAARANEVRVHGLPSSSPANARTPLALKTKIWRDALALYI